jgi:hypothetical protein
MIFLFKLLFIITVIAMLLFQPSLYGIQGYKDLDNHDLLTLTCTVFWGQINLKEFV